MLLMLQEVLQYIEKQHKLLLEMNLVTMSSLNNFENLCRKIKAKIVKLLKEKLHCYIKAEPVETSFQEDISLEPSFSNRLVNIMMPNLITQTKISEVHESAQCSLTESSDYGSLKLPEISETQCGTTKSAKAVQSDISGVIDYSNSYSLPKCHADLKDSMITAKKEIKSEQGCNTSGVAMHSKPSKIAVKKICDIEGNFSQILNTNVYVITNNYNSRQRNETKNDKVELFDVTKQILQTAESELADIQRSSNMEGDKIFDPPIKNNDNIKRNDKNVDKNVKTIIIADSGKYRKKYFYCDINKCSKRFCSQKVLDKHQRLHENKDNLFSCDTCNKVFESKQVLESHLPVHTEKRKYVCDICGKRFAHNSTLFHHTRFHKGIKKYECKICDKKFVTKSNLNYHNLTHTGKREFACEFCNGKFFTSTILKHHLRTHSNIRPFKCKFCSYSANLKGTLECHIASIHTGNRPFKCTECDKSFPREAIRKQHYKLCHVLEKKFSCETCGNKYVTESLLNYHKLIHLGIKPFQCDVCGARFLRKGDLKRHSKTHVKKLCKK